MVLALLSLLGDDPGSGGRIASVAGIDHIVVGAPSLDAAIRDFHDRTGVEPERGGRHPGRGTENALVAIGPHTYLELIAPSADAPKNEDTAALSALGRPTPIAWAVTTRDIVSTSRDLAERGFIPTKEAPGSRQKPTGETLEWKTLEIATPEVAGAPFFIEWSAKSPHPATTSPRGCELVSLALSDPHPERLRTLLDALGVGVDLRVGRQSAMTLALRCPKGTVVFGD